MPVLEETTVVFRDWVMLDRTGRTYYFDDGDPVHEARKKAVDPAAVGVITSSGLSGYFSFTLATPPRVSYLDLYWPRAHTKFRGFPIDHVYPSVLAADQNLVLLRLAIPNMFPHDLFVYTAAGPRPSLKKLPLDTVPAPKLDGSRKFFSRKSDIGILRLDGDQGHYVVADLFVSGSHNKKTAQLCVFSSASKTRSPWKVSAPQLSDGGQFPVRWLTSTVLPFHGRYLCWVDYYAGLLLSDFSKSSAPVPRFVPFPGEQYTDKVLRRPGRCCPDRFRSVSISQGMMRFVHIDSDFHKINGIGEDIDDDADTDHKRVQKSVPKITIWTFNVAEFKWEDPREMSLDKIWEQPIYTNEGITPGRLPEFPVISVDNPDLVWCLLRQEDFRGKTWMAELDMKRAELRSCTPYVNEQPNGGQNRKLENSFATVPPLPTVFSKFIPTQQGYWGTATSLQPVL